MTQKPTVFVGLSGGVDSSVAALRLLKQGYNVVGVFIKVWHPDFMVCNWEAERLDAMRVAATLDIPFLTCDAEAAYKERVADHFISEYLAGRTPNPDILCNQAVKFGCFFDFAMEREADFIATGHYVQNLEGELHRGVDASKDQSYFLWTLTKDRLAKSLFPVGKSPKSVIRQEAAEAGLDTATKRDSQGICFLGHVDIPTFLSHYTHLQPGNVLDESGKIIGAHEGALVYTLGQRHGFQIHNDDPNRGAHYVVSKDVENNTITVGVTPPAQGQSTEVRLSSITLRSPLKEGDVLSAQFRYRQEPFSVTIIAVRDTEIRLSVNEEVTMPAEGQSCVLYRSTHCLGGGVITR
jgi:tRNA-specific 2-thiouridylase